MKKNIKVLLLVIAGIISVGIGAVLMKSGSTFFLFFFTLGFVLMIVGAMMFFKKDDPESIYNSTIKSILNTYDSILVKSSSVPSLEGRNIVEVSSINDLVDAQLEIRKPICYLKQTESCSFILLDEKEAYIYVDKLNDKVKSPVEIELEQIRIKEKNNEDIDSELIKNIENTTIIKLSNQKSYKVSPIRKHKKNARIEHIELLEDVEVL